MIPTLIGKKIVLTPFTQADAPLVQKYAGDEEVARTTLNIPHPYPDGAAEKWIAGHLLAFFEKKTVTFAIRSPEGELFGAIGIMLKTPVEMGELGYFIGRPFWGQGIVTDAAATITKYAFEELGLNKVYAVHMGCNPASGRVMEKVGMTKEGTQRQHMKKNGEWQDVVLYGILQADYGKMTQGEI